MSLEENSAAGLPASTNVVENAPTDGGRSKAKTSLLEMEATGFAASSSRPSAPKPPIGASRLRKSQRRPQVATMLRRYRLLATSSASVVGFAGANPVLSRTLPP